MQSPLRGVTPLRAMLLAILALALLGACQTPPVQEGDPFVVADLFATPGKALATIALSPTPQPTSTIPNIPSPTPGPTLPIPTARILEQPTLPLGTFGPTPTRAVPGVRFGTPTPGAVACTVAPPMPFTPVWQNIAQVQSLLRCPVGDPMQVGGVWQAYEYGAMFWREQDRSIFVISELAIRQGQPSDRWWRIVDTFQEGEPESDPGLQPPPGMRQPIRGFGKVWRSNAFVREGVGWATGDEIGMTSVWQMFEGGWMMTGPNGAPVYVMVPSDAPPYSSGIHLGPMP